MKKMIMPLCAALAAATILAGCGGKGEPQNAALAGDSGAENGAVQTETVQAEKTKLTFLRVGTEPERKAYWESAVAAFLAANPDIEIEYQECGYGDDFETKLNTGFASGTAPDIINFTMASMGTRVPLGQYACLDEYAAQWDGKDDFMENALTLGSVGDSLYGIAVFPDPRILIYNTELFAEAGLNPAAPPANWEELLEYHKKLVKKDGDNVIQTGFGIPTSGTNMQHYLSVFIEENGVKNLVDEESHQVLCNTPEAVEAAEFLKEIADAGIIRWDSNNSDQNPFASGLAAMTLGNMTDFHNWNQGAVSGKIAMASPLTHKRQATFCGMGFMFMSGETPHKDEAWRFIEFIASPDEMWRRYEELGVTPMRESLRERYVAENPENNGIIYESINCGTGSPKVAYANSVYNAVNDAMERVMYGVEDPAAALDTAAAEIQKEIDNQ